MKKYQVNIVLDAEQDLADLYQYVAANDSVVKAHSLLSKLEDLCLSLECFPERGHVPPELARLAITQYKEIHFKPYRIIYQINQMNVYIHCILDGRRSLEDLLMQRLLHYGIKP